MVCSLLHDNSLLQPYVIGGPVILVQAENEYSGFQAPYTEDFVYQEKLLQDFVRITQACFR